MTFGDRGFHEVLGAAFGDSEDGTAILATSMGEVSLWRLDTGAFVGVVGMHRKAALSVAVSPDCWSVMTAGSDRLAVVWSIQRSKVKEQPPYRSAGAGRKASQQGPRAEDSFDPAALQDQLELDGHAHVVNTAVYSADGRFALTGCMDGTAKVWRTDEARLLTTLRGHAASVCGAAFFGSGAFLATASADGTVKIWSARTRKCVRDIDVHQQGVKCVIAFRRRAEKTTRATLRVSFADMVKNPGPLANEASKDSKETPRKETPRKEYCQLCRRREADTAVVPCGHLCGCSACLNALLASSSVARCPKCGAEASSVLRISKD